MRRYVTIEAGSIKELEAHYDRCKAVANETGNTIIIRQKLKLGRNERCACFSGRKWKKCCIGDAETTVPAFPAGHRPERTPHVTATTKAVALGLFGFLT